MSTYLFELIVSLSDLPSGEVIGALTEHTDTSVNLTMTGFVDLAGAILLGVVLAVVAAVTLGVFKLGDKPPQTLTQARTNLL